MSLITDVLHYWRNSLAKTVAVSLMLLAIIIQCTCILYAPWRIFVAIFLASSYSPNIGTLILCCRSCSSLMLTCLPIAIGNNLSTGNFLISSTLSFTFSFLFLVQVLWSVSTIKTCWNKMYCFFTLLTIRSKLTIIMHSDLLTLWKRTSDKINFLSIHQISEIFLSLFSKSKNDVTCHVMVAQRMDDDIQQQRQQQLEARIKPFW